MFSIFGPLPTLPIESVSLHLELFSRHTKRSPKSVGIAMLEFTATSNYQLKWREIRYDFVTSKFKKRITIRIASHQNETIFLLLSSNFNSKKSQQH